MHSSKNSGASTLVNNVIRFAFVKHVRCVAFPDAAQVCMGCGSDIPIDELWTMVSKFAPVLRSFC